LSAVTNKAISDYLSQKGIYHSIQGYKYLMICLRAILDGEVDRDCMKAVYEHVAAANGVSANRAEQAIRAAIRKTAEPVPNKEFLFRAADELALAADANAFIFESVKPKNQS